MGNRRLIINLTANVLNFGIGLGVSFLFTPYLIKTLGEEVYGFTQLASNFTSYIAILTAALNSMALRYITISIHDKNDDEANRYFNTVFFANIGMSILASAVFIPIAMHIQKLIAIPVALTSSVSLLFVFVFFSFIVGICFSVFGAATFSNNRLEIRAVVSALEALLRVALLVLLFSVFKPNIAYVGLAGMIVVVTDSIVSVRLSKKFLPRIRVGFAKFDKALITVLLGSGIWNSFLQLSTVLLTGLDLLIANVFIGPTYMSLLAIANTFPNYISSFSSVISGTFTPRFTILYATKRNKDLLMELKYSLKIVGILVNIPISGLAVFGGTFFRLWLPSQNPSELQLLSIIIIGTMFISGGILPLYSVFTITNNLRLPAITLLVTGVLNVAIVLILLKITNMGIYAIAGVSTVLTSLREIVFIPTYAAKCLEQKWGTFYPNILRMLVSTASMTAVFFIVNSLTNINSWLELAVVVIPCGLAGIIMNIFLTLNQAERNKFIRLIRETIARILPMLDRA